ncbi:MAG: Hpt domain-containing protein [Bacteroidetes bacterium]|nr:Hpt domain-containing protein [Bacteroidota bacterium]
MNTEPTLFDLSELINLSDGNMEFVQSMVDLFITQSEENAELIKEHYEKGDLGKVKAIVHSMKPSILIMGIYSLKEDISSIEDYTRRNENNAHLSELIAKMEESLLKVSQQLKEYHVI